MSITGLCSLNSSYQHRPEGLQTATAVFGIAVELFWGPLAAPTGEHARYGGKASGRSRGSGTACTAADLPSGACASAPIPAPGSKHACQGLAFGHTPGLNSALFSPAVSVALLRPTFSDAGLGSQHSPAGMDSLDAAAAALVASCLLDERDLASLRCTNRFWRDVLSDNPGLWSQLLARRFGVVGTAGQGSSGGAANPERRFQQLAMAALRRPVAGLDRLIWLDGTHLQVRFGSSKLHEQHAGTHETIVGAACMHSPCA